MKTYDINDIILRISNYKLKNKTYSKWNKIHAFDTETYKGYAFLITCDDGSYQLINSFEEAIEFLTRDRLRKCVNFFYNINFDFFAIIKYLDYDTLNELWKNGKIEIGKIKLNFIPNKFFSITKNKTNFAFYDLAQFYDYKSLDEVSKKYLGMEKIKIDIEKYTKNKNTIKQNLSKIIQYSIHDAYLTRRLGEILRDKLKTFNIHTKPYSHAKLSETYFRQKTLIYTPKNRLFLQYALNSYRGGWFEVFKRGCFEAYEYDINSAYPSAIAELKSLEKYEFNFMRRDYDDNADYSIVKVKVNLDIDKMPFSLLWNNLRVYPVGEFGQYVLNDELKFLDKINVNYEIVDSLNIYCYFKKKIFEKEIKRLYELKNKTQKGSIDYHTYKILLNSFYGKFIQLSKRRIEDKYKTGAIFNPLYAAYITAKTRLKIAELCLRYGDDILAIHTDSIITTKKILNSSDELGAWKLTEKGKCVVIGSGVYAFENKSRIRGFKTKTNLFDLIKQNKNKTKIKIITYKPIKLGEIINFHKIYKHHDLNVFEKVVKELRVNFDIKRLWLSKFRVFGDVFKKEIDSAPLHINMLISSS